MSVVAGCSLFDGVLLAADCRATFKRKNGDDVYSDNVLKVFALFPHTAIGFVGAIDVASYLLKTLITQLRNRKHTDPISLSNWFSRLFQYEFKKYTTQYGDRTVHFMVASVLKGRPNVVERKAVVDLVKYIGFDKSPIKRNFMPSILIEILKTSNRFKLVKIPGTSQGMLYVLASPAFKIIPYNPLQFAAIGSGESSVQEIARYHDAILALDPGNSFVEGSQFRQVIQNFIQEKGIESVGGLYPAVKVSGNGIEHLAISQTIPAGGTRIELAFQSGRWLQRNVTTGKEIPILMPWEFLKIQPSINNKFDDLIEAFKHFRD